MIDLHCHTNCSDGTLSPLEVIDLAMATGLQALAITDHDTFEGYDLARPLALEQGLELLCGIELGTRLANVKRSAHLLGYFLLEPEAELRTWLLQLQISRRERNAELLERLQQQGIDITWEQLRAKAQKQIGRPHFAQVLLESGRVQSLKEAFDLYLAESGSAWTQRDEPSTEEAIGRIVKAGGVASLAHPVRLSRDMETLSAIIATLVPAGLAAVECYHIEHTAEETRQLLDIAAAHGLAATGGSDFHGANKPGISLGTGDSSLAVPLELLVELKRRLRDAANNRPGCATFR
jgi:predicted metal-dependent phosphoesterase TrpH